MASGKQVEAGGAFVRIFADDSPLRRALKDAAQRIKNFAKPFIGAGKLIGGALVVVTSGLVALTKKFANYADAIGDAAARTGLSSQALSELGYAAQLSGSNVEDLEKAFRVFQKQLVSGANANALKTLGIDADSLKKASPDRQLNTIIAALARIQDPTQKAAMAMQVFGKAGANLVPLLNEGEAGIAKLRDEAKKLGVSLSSEQVAAGQAFNDALDKMSAALNGIVTRIGGAVAPMLTWLADQVIIAANAFSDWLKDVTSFVGSFETAMATINFAFVAAWTNIYSVQDSIIGKIKVGVESLRVFLIDAFDTAGNAIVQGWSAYMNQVVKLVANMTKQVSDPLASILEKAGLENAANVVRGAATGIGIAAPVAQQQIGDEQAKKQKEFDDRKKSRAIELAQFMAKVDGEQATREQHRTDLLDKAHQDLMASMNSDQAKAEENARRRAEKAQMGMAQAVGDTGGGAETAGTFTAAAISGLGAGSLQADMLSALKEVAGNTAALVDEVAAGGLQP
jgi:hypothetical protein